MMIMIMIMIMTMTVIIIIIIINVIIVIVRVRLWAGPVAASPGARGAQGGRAGLPGDREFS